MISDKLENLSRYAFLNKNITDVCNFIKNNDLALLANGKHVINDESWIVISEYQTKPQCKPTMEAHKNYVDIQFTIVGKEILFFNELEDQPLVKEYDESADYALYSAPTYGNIVLENGTFTILFPSDLHSGSYSVEEGVYVKKAVVKMHV